MAAELFNPQRLRIARKRRGQSFWSIATEIGVRVPHVAKWERGTMVPNTVTVEMLAECLRFPVEWFYGPDLPELPLDRVSHL